MHIYVGLAHFLWFKIFNFITIFGFQQNELFWGYDNFVDIFIGGVVIAKLGCFWEVIIMHFRLFSSLQMKVRNGIYLFGVAKISNYVLGMPDIPDIFGG